MVISDVGTTNNLVQGNFIGVDTSGSRSLANAFAGVGIYSGAQSNLIGGATTQARNFISGNRSYGVQIAGLGSDGNRVQGNFIGTDINGTAAVLNSFAGVGIYGGAKRNTIGGSTPEARNLISGHDSYGIIIADSGTKNNWVAGNFIGTELTGSRSLKNGFAGIGIYAGAQGNLVGGTATSARNVISGNNAYGVIIQGQEASGNLFQGNFIGTQADGTAALGNGFNGIGLFGGPSQNIIGLAIDGTGAGNTVAFNASDGIRLDDTNSVGNTIRGNRIYSNGGLGIELGGPSYFGVTANDAGDADMGPNQLQNYPILTSAAARSATTTITGTFHSAPNRAYIVDIYRGTSPDPSGHGEGQSYVGTTSLSTDANGNGSFTMSDSGNFAGQYFSATATDATTGDTSEFSSALLATNAPFSSHFVGPYVRNSSGFTFELYLQTNRAYRLQGTANLGADPIPWLDLTNFTAPSSPIQFIDRSASNYPARFYRVISP